MSGHDPDDRGDDADGTGESDDRPDDWPDDWTTADDASHAPDGTPDDEADAEATDGETAAGTPSDGAPDSATDGERVEAEAVDDEPESADVSETTAAGGESTLGERPSTNKPSAPSVDDESPTIADDGIVTWFLNTSNGAVVFVRDVVSSVAAVAAIGLLLFAVSGIWPPLVAVESGSMEPHMAKGDLVFIVAEDRYTPQSAVGDTGVSTYDAANAAEGYWKFGGYGDVVVYEPYGDERATPIIHRARFHVEEGENWVADANPEYLGNVDSCAEVPRNMCPAPYDGFVTKGDAVSTYDQVGSQSTIVKKEWIRGKAQVRVPLLGWIRLQFAQLTSAASTGVAPAGVAPAGVEPTGVAPTSGLVARVGALGAALGAAVVATRT